jgi:hypothetical protein
MLNKKMISLSLLSMVVCSLAFSAEYKTPKVAFKGHAPAKAEMVAADTGENLKVEGYSNNDRQIASEEDKDREPSSLKTDSKKKEVVVEEKHEYPDSEVQPKPWLYRMESQSQK